MRFERIRALRDDNDYTQQQIADILHVSQRAYSNYETGERSIPIDILIKLADHYNVSLDYIVGRIDNADTFVTSRRYPDIQSIASAVAEEPKNKR